MDESAVIVLSNFLNNIDTLVDDLNEKIIQLLGLNSNDVRFQQVIRDCIENSNFSQYEKMYLKSLKGIVDENLTAIGNQISHGRIASYDKWIEKMEKFADANYSIEYDLITLANLLSRTFKLKMTRDELYSHLKQREPEILKYIKEYNKKIIDILKTTIELSAPQEQNFVNQDKNPTINSNDASTKEEMQREMIEKKQNEINKRQERIQSQQEKLNRDVDKLNNRIEKLNQVENDKSVKYKRLDVEIMKTNDFDKLLDIRAQIKSVIKFGDVKDVMTRTSLKEDLNLVVNKIFKIAVNNSKSVELKQLPKNKDGIAQLIFLDKYFDILEEIPNENGEDFEYFVNYGLIIIGSSWSNDFDQADNNIDKYKALNNFINDICRFRPYIKEEKYNELINLIEELKNSVSNESQKQIQLQNNDKNNRE